MVTLSWLPWQNLSRVIARWWFKSVIAIFLSFQVLFLYHTLFQTVVLKSNDQGGEKGKGAKKSAADGCHHVFVDGGANIGVHGRFLLEPEKYPKAKLATAILDAQFGIGARRDNRDFCVFEIEPNPAHFATLTEKSEAYANMGWRYDAMNVGLGDRNGELSFYRRKDEVNEEWGFSVRKFFDDAEEVKVKVIRFSEWLQENVISRELPAVVHGTYSMNATIVVKLDIEGSEYMVLPDLISSGVFCNLDHVFGEFHSRDAPLDFPGLGVPLEKEEHLKSFEQAMMYTMRGFGRSCKAKFLHQDDETYLHDGIPLPIPK